MRKFTFDSEKARTNKRDHRERSNVGVTFEADAQLVFEDPNQLERDNSFVDGEYRREIIGMIRGLLIITVVFTVIDEDTEQESTRIISARKASQSEQRDYLRALESLRW